VHALVQTNILLMRLLQRTGTYARILMAEQNAKSSLAALALALESEVAPAVALALSRALEVVRR
jgi:hypothetical protein